MRIVVVGSGGREHAIAWTLAKKHEILVTPGNLGMQSCAEVVDRSPLEIDADLYVIGPEVPLVAGLADQLRAQGRTVFGPGRDGAQLEGSKVWMKDLLFQAGVPTADFLTITDISEGERYLKSRPGPYVIKTDGLAGGKGVLVTHDLSQAIEDLRTKLSGTSFGGAGKTVVIEEAMTGPEISLLAICDGKRAFPLPVATDFKRVFDGDVGPNTGGMGAHSPVPWAGKIVVEEVMERAVKPVLAELRRRGIDYRGVLYAGMMLTRSGPKVVEFNVRFGDPEAQVVLPRVSENLGEILFQAASGRVEDEVKVDQYAWLTVVLAAGGYPGRAKVGTVISGLDMVRSSDDLVVFHSGTGRDVASGDVVVNAGRVLSVTARGSSLLQARERAYAGAKKLHFEGKHMRTDIGLKAISN